jgi:exonuclease III
MERTGSQRAWLPVCPARFPPRARAPSPVHNGAGARAPSPVDVGAGGTTVGLVSWNVNGLLPCLKRMGFKLLEELLESFGPDVHIVCLQEAKLQQSQLDQTLARPKGWDAFYSFATQSQADRKVGYSGTATFVRQESRPIDATHDLAPLCCLADIPALLWNLDLFGARAFSAEPDSRRKRAAPDDEEAHETDLPDVDDVHGGGLFRLVSETSPDDLKSLCSEGRFIATDHGDFVLFNCYFPVTHNFTTV